MTSSGLQALTAWVLWASFGIAFAFGAIAQHTRFCTMGAVADIATFGDWARMRMWMLAMGTAILGFNLMVAMGWISAASSIYAGSSIPWLSTLVGGGMFGVGMVLSSGCASKNLLRAGAGNLKAVVVLLVVASSGFATLKGITAVLRNTTVDSVHAELAGGQDLPSTLARATGFDGPTLAAVAGVVIGGLLIVSALLPRDTRSKDLILGGIGIGGLVVCAWWVSGVLGYVPEHPETLESVYVATSTHRMEGLSFVSATAYSLDYLLFFSDANKLATIGMVSALGLVLGAMAYSIATRSFRWESFRTVQDMRNHLFGGALMGIGGVTALGCSIGQGVSGLSTLSISSFIAVFSMIGSAFAALRFQAWRMERVTTRD